jgi:N-acetylmuramic acid 6-phosphate etherase
MVLNMLSTATMIRLGYVTGNRMTNMRARNTKLHARALRILAAETGASGDEAGRALAAAGDDLRVALVMRRAGVEREAAVAALEAARWVVDRAVASLGVADESRGRN